MKLPLPKPPQKPKAIKVKGKTLSTEQINQYLKELSKGFKDATAEGDYITAHKKASNVLDIIPHHVTAMMDLAYVELRLQRYQDAYQHYLKAINLQPNQVNPNIYDGLVEVCHFLDKQDEVRKYGALAISSKKKQVQNLQHYFVEKDRPVFNAQNPQKNIISFSLFGKNSKYCETAILNASLSKEIYPEWTCRFYLDDSVPDHVKERLKGHGAQVIEVNEEKKKISGLFWRFFVMDDAGVDFFLIRDADSLISYKEKAAVDEWVQSSKWFHTMRDYFTHTELILAGMWGGCVGIFHHIEKMIVEYLQHGDFLTNRVADQHFLRHCIWTTVEQNLLSHDSQGFDVQATSFPLPQQQKEYELAGFHIGSNFASAIVKVKVGDISHSKVHWTLVDENKKVICDYDAVVLDSREIEVNLPKLYVDEISAQKWSIKIYPYEID